SPAGPPGYLVASQKAFPALGLERFGIDIPDLLMSRSTPNLNCAPPGGQPFDRVGQMRFNSTRSIPSCLAVLQEPPPRPPWCCKDEKTLSDHLSGWRRRCLWLPIFSPFHQSLSSAVQRAGRHYFQES